MPARGKAPTLKKSSIDLLICDQHTVDVARLGPPAGLAYEAVRHVHNDVVSDVSCVGAGDAWRCSRVGAATSVAG